MELTNLQSTRTLALHSGCNIAFVLDNTETIPKIIPVLLLNGVTALGDDPYVWLPEAEGKIGIITTQYNDITHKVEVMVGGPDNGQPIAIDPYIGISHGDWLVITEQQIDNKEYEMVYPRIFVNSLQLSTDSQSLIVKYKTKESRADNLSLLQQYQDYSVLSRSLLQQYAITLNNDLVFKNNIEVSDLDNQYTVEFKQQPLSINYNLSNADINIYLDALQILKENAYPKVSYNIKINYLNKEFCNKVYNSLGAIAHINDNDLKLNNIRGYVSSFTLDLDDPDNDTIEIKDYKNKFEDLFSTIAVETEAMKKNNYILEFASTAFTSSGELSEEVLQSSLKKVNLDYAFNNGKLTIDQNNGIWGSSESGVVAFRGGGIFTATEKNAEGNWKWNTGITPQGINADLITSGQIDTNLIKIYAGDHLRFQMNGDGIFAYKTKLSDASYQDQEHPYSRYNKITDQEQLVQAGDDIDSKQYVVFNENGLSLIAKKGALVLNSNKNDYYQVLNDYDTTHHVGLAGLNEIVRVEVGWRGLILRNWYNEQVFFADPETGNLTLNGTIEAKKGYIGEWNINSERLYCDSKTLTTQDGELRYNSYVALNAGGSSQEEIHINDNTTERANTALYAFWAGDRNPQRANFSITKTGQVNAVSGEIGGWVIAKKQLSSTYIRLFSNINQVSVYTNAQYKSTTQDSALVIYNNVRKANSDGVIFLTTSGTIFARDYYLYFPQTNSSGYYRSLSDILKQISKQ